MGHVKAVLLAIALFVLGVFAFVLAVIALLVSPVFPKVRYFSNLFFILPFSWIARKIVD